MDAGDRPHPHRATSTTGELFICFTSRPSASSSSAPAAMRVPSSKPLMSPARAQNPAAPSLSASLSRRLRSSSSVKGGQSPMFPAGVVPRKKGCAFEVAEPSSPKVTCIGQVRVKSKKKKKGKNGVGAVVRSRSQRRSSGEASFRRSVVGEGEACGERECKRWALAVCEAIRTLGSELNCFVPCKGGRSFCASSSASREEEESNGGGEKRTRSSCGAVLARWLMAIQDSEEGKRGEVVGLMVENEERRQVEEEEVERMVVVETKKEEVEVVVKEEEEETVVEEGRVSVRVPPKNALLLMRCRSDPVRMAALATRFWGSPAAAKVGVVETAEEDDDEDEDEDEGEDKDGGLEIEEGAGEEVVEVEAEEVKELGNNNSHGGVDQDARAEEKEQKFEDLKAEEEDRQQEAIAREEEASKDQTVSAEILATPAKGADHNVEEKKMPKEQEIERVKASRSSRLPERRSKAKEREMRRSLSSKEKDRRRNSFSGEREARRHSFSTERDARRASFSVDTETKARWSFSDVREEKPTGQEGRRSKKEAPTEKEQASKARELEKKEEEEEEVKVKQKESNGEKKEEKKRELPDCLLLMMYEPKLSMEVSKETWVCSNDFLQWRNHHPGEGPPPPPQVNNASERGDNKPSEIKEVIPAGDASVHPLPLAAPPAQPLPKEVERKLFGTPAPVAYEPFVLTRCKSEPMRSSARLAPDACFWKSRHQPIGAAGIGF